MVGGGAFPLIEWKWGRKKQKKEELIDVDATDR